MQDVLGKQGIGRRTPFQLLFVFNQLWKRLKEEAGDKYLDEIVALTMNELATNDVWKDEAEKKFPQAFRELMGKFAELESEEDDSGIDGLVSLLIERPKNLQDPIFSTKTDTAEHCATAAVHEEIHIRQIKIKNNNWKKEFTIK